MTWRPLPLALIGTLPLIVCAASSSALAQPTPPTLATAATAPSPACVADLVPAPDAPAAGEGDLRPAPGGGYHVSDVGMAAIEARVRGCALRLQQAETLRAIACEHGAERVAILAGEADRARDRARLASEERDRFRVHRDIALVGGAMCAVLALVLGAAAGGI